MIEREIEVGSVLGGERGQRQHHVGHVQALVVRDGAADLDLGLQPVRAGIEHAKHQLPVVDKKARPLLDRLENLLVRQVDPFGGARGLVPIEKETLAVVELNTVAAEPADPELRPLKIGQDRCRPLQLLFEAADDLDPRSMILVAAVTHVDAKCIRARSDEAADHLGSVAGRAERRKDADLTAAGHDRARHRLSKAAALLGSLGPPVLFEVAE